MCVCVCTARPVKRTHMLDGNTSVVLREETGAGRRSVFLSFVHCPDEITQECKHILLIETVHMLQVKKRFDLRFKKDNW